MFKVESTSLLMSRYSIEFQVQGFFVINYKALFKVRIQLCSNFSNFTMTCISKMNKKTKNVFFIASERLFHIHDLLHTIFIEISPNEASRSMQKQLDLA